MKRFLFRMILAMFHVAQMIGSVLKYLGRLFMTPVFSLAKKGYRFVLLPAYTLWTAGRQQWQKIFRPAKHKLVYPLTARPMVHITVIVLVFLVTAANLHARTPDDGQTSILYGMVGNDDTDLIVETAQSRPATDAYLGLAFGVSAQQGQAVSEPVQTEPLPLVTSGGSAMAMAPTLPGASTGNTSGPQVSRVRSEVETYTVRAGDNIGSIAAAFGLSQTTILNANNLGSRDVIKPGQSLKILPTDGVTYTVRKGDTISKLASLFGVEANDIRTANNLKNDQTLGVSQELMIPGGKRIIQQAKPKLPTLVARAPIVDRILNAFEKPAASPNANNSSLIWPTSGHVITQYWSWHHTGVDIDGDYDSPIYAAEDGVVETAGWNNAGYGIQAIVNHEDGFKTRYGHMSKIFVTTGQQVKKGEVIGMIGTTGHSTGTHLHFEVYINGVRSNPLLYDRR